MVQYALYSALGCGLSQLWKKQGWDLPAPERAGLDKAVRRLFKYRMATQHDSRMHTAEHLLNQTMVRMFDCGRCLSAHLNRKKSKCDYSLPRDLTRAEKEAVEQRVNEVIAADLEVVESFVFREEAAARFDLSRLPDDSGSSVRIVHIGDFDCCPCIGSHVRSTGELGRFRISTHDFQDGILRIRFKLETES